MDSAKSSLTGKTQHVNNGGGSESPMEETVPQTVDGERQRETETRAPDVFDGITADLNIHHKGSADKQKYSTIGYQRRTKQKVVTDFATLSKGTSAGAKPRTALKQVLFSQGVSDKASEERSQLDGLKQVLEAYSLSPVDLRWRWNEESQGTTLETSWTDIVQSHSTMSKMQRHQQEALWEFVHTELVYINKLLVIRDLVIATLVRLHQKGFLLEVTPEQLFFNLPSIVEAHQLFWQEVVFPMLQEARKTAKPFDPMRLEPGCLQFHDRFSSYHGYCWEEDNNLEFSRRQMESNPHFSTYVQWVENHPQGYRMRLGDMQAKPHQRITKYPLLLKAVLKHTQDPHVQHTLRGMLSSVNYFLEDINDYLREKDEKLALNISAQRLEGYEVDGLNEEIDRNVREICHFDLECPIKGVGPGVIRKLLLEENLKVRGRKDSKLELVALLFSDVLLLTKVQKKTERLKVVRPPLALDRMYCKPLKDGCSFLLVEVGELQSPMNVLILVASASDSCSSWVYTIHQAKETLRQLRETERKRLETLKLNHQDKNPVKEAMTDDVETEEQPVTQPGMETSMDESTDDTFISNTINGSSAEPEQYQSPEEMDTDKTELHFWYTEPTNPLIIMPTNKRKIGSKRSALKPQAFIGPEWIEMEMRQDQGGNQGEDEDKIVESQITDKPNVTLRQRVQSAPTLDSFSHISAAQPFRRNTVRPYSFLPGELPDVDYPTDEGNILPSNQPIIMKGPDLLRQQEISTRKNPDSLSVKQETSRNSSGSLFPDTRTPQQVWVSRNLKSPVIQRRRPVSTNPATFRTSKQFFQSLEQTGAASNNYSSSNLDSNDNPKLKRSSVPTNMSYQFNPAKSNQDMFWNDRVFSDAHAFSESELPDTKFENKKPKIKTHRSSSVSSMKPKGKARLRPPSGSLHTPTQAEDEHSSRLEGLLERAKDRERGRGGLIKDRNFKTTNLRSRYPSPPSFSPPRSDGDTDLEEVEVTRSKAPSVSQRWKEQLVDGDEDEPGNSVFVDGENVDWSGWCFDDDEVNDRLRPSKNGFLEEFNRSLALYGIGELSEQEDGECSQV